MPPKTPIAPKRLKMAFALWGVALVIVALALIAIASDVSAADATGGNGYANKGAEVGTYFGIAIRTTVLLLVALLFFVLGREHYAPESFGRHITTRKELRRRAEETREHRFAQHMPDDETTLALDAPRRDRYCEVSDSELLSVFDNLDPSKAPESFDALVQELRLRATPGPTADAPEEESATPRTTTENGAKETPRRHSTAS